MKRRFIFFLIFFTIIIKAFPAQDKVETVKLSLQNVIDQAIEQSPSIKYYQNRNVNYYWRWKNFQANFRPQLGISGDLPDYRFSNEPITQPDGSIEFRQIAQLRTTADLALTQIIPHTGTTIYGASSLYRVHDYNLDKTDWSGSPFYIGFVQPLFAFNWWKWSRKTEPLIYEESQKRYIESVERVSLSSASRFFTYLRIQTNYNLATSNLKNSEDNLKIAEVKRKLGQISENDFSRIQLSVLNAKKALNKSNMDLKNADFELKSYIGMDQNTNIELIIPLEMSLFFIDPQKALKETLENRKEAPEFERRLIEADRDLTRAKRNTGLRTTLRGSYGTVKSSADLGGVYKDTEKQQTLRLSLNIPILDWGKSASAVKLAESRRELVLYGVEREKLDFEREIVVQAEKFNLLESQMETAKEADKVAGNGYLIALKKFQNGEISITDLNISLSEREKAKRDYIASLEDYWESFYFIRILTLYDFELNQKITYLNPSLSLN
ncbi:MAG: TolC family protein [Cyclobacteriaceae bacterium]|nr:TolC family protein [Cyclobacteriaceae bacterium]MCK5368261.1 TolC family protein [Cyclobacteriaceae bacterium]MCK5470072.1 TolC family protein [Cyclobacteriaceae bacterium]